MEVIDSFTGDFGFLSNFSPHPIELSERIWPTAEHLFQALKTFSFAEQEAIRLQPTPGKAKRMGRKVTLAPRWDQKRIEAMTFVVREKFDQHPAIAELLISTGDAELIEGNNWGDRFWGQVNGEGENHLGRILMQIRKELNT